eukprot:TRINITY_DN6342_c0_g1_i2.p1 TRINITY_DN6342_c0_g1~~TRINITY_DN6342_c0_g1_i2.p1  ORF type:complete len:143 (+),score=33.62 TRINITY_DN6342_c0_g1_i2:29-457(+)
MAEYNPDNVFRKILDGQIPSYKIFETEHALAILDAFPMVKGHSLLIPKGNYTTVGDMPAEAAADFFASLPKLVNAVKAATGCDGVNILSNAGAAAGQVVMHVHVHVVPRNEEDKLIKFPPSGDMIAKDVADELVKSIQEKLN